MRDTLLVVALALVTATAPVVTSAAPTGTATDETVELIIQFEGEEVTDKDLELLRSLGFEGGHLYRTIPAVYTAGPQSSIDELARHPDVKNVEQNRPLVYYTDSSRKAIGAEASPAGPGATEDLGLTGQETTIAVVDTGIDATHPDLPFGEKVISNHKIVAPVIESETEFSNETFGMLNMSDTDDNGHGTHVAGTACGTGAASEGRFTGVAPDCKLVGVGMGVGRSMALATAGLDWVLAHHEELGIDIVSNSWGIQGGGSFDEDGTVETLIRQLWNEGVLPVFAAGNSGPDEGTLSPFAKSPHAIGVANFDDTNRVIAESSSRGVPDDPFRSPDEAAPGVGIVAPRSTSAGRPTLGNYTGLTGTSMSAPHVSGVASLLLQANPDLTPAQLKEVITRTADSDRILVPSDGGFRAAQHFEQGAGVVDADEAAAKILGAPGVDATIDGTNDLDQEVLQSDTLTVTGTVTELADQARPGHWPISGDTILFHNFTAVLFDPDGATSEKTVLAGEQVTLAVRNTGSGHPAFDLDRHTDARFRVTQLETGQTEALIDVPLPHERVGDRIFDIMARWQVPADIEPGDYRYTLELDTGPGDGWIKGPSAPIQVRNAGVAAPLPVPIPDLPDTPDLPSLPTEGGPPAGAQVDNPIASGNFSFEAVDETVLFEDDLETFDPAYETTNNGGAHGALTEWTYVGDAAPLANTPHSGNHSYYVGVSPTGASSGSTYTDVADARLRLPTVDLSGANEANLSYYLSGGSEDGFDFLFVEAKATGTSAWTELANHTGQSFDWTQHNASLDAFAGQTIDIRFRFSSDLIVTIGPGWMIDDLRVTGTLGNVAPDASLSLDDVTGTIAEFGLDGTDPDGSIQSWTLAFGDGTQATGTALPATVTHDYGEQAIFDAELSVQDDADANGTSTVEVSTVHGVQVNLGDGWVDAVDDSQAGDWSTWHADVDLSSVEDGFQTLEARFPDGQGGFHVDVQPYVLARDPVVGTDAPDAHAKGELFNLSVDVVGVEDPTIAWDLDDDGAFDDATGQTATNVSFEEAGDKTVQVRVRDTTNTTRETIETIDVPIFERRSVLAEDGIFVKGVPEEAASFIFLGYQPGLSVEHHSFELNLTELRSGVEDGRVVGLEATLDWSHAMPRAQQSDLDLWTQRPDDSISSQGATAANPEHVSFADPANGTWTLYVEPFLVVQPTIYELDAELQVVPE